MFDLLLSSLSTKTIGWIATIIIFVFLFISFITGIKLGIKKMFIKMIIMAISMAVAIFAAKPLLSLGDKIFNFSLLFIDIYLAIFGKFSGLNVVITSSNYVSELEKFKSSDIGLASNIKEMLISIFESTGLKSGESTTFSMLAARIFSYLTSLFILAIILYVLVSITLNIIAKIFIFKKNDKNQGGFSRVLSGFIGLICGAYWVLIMMVTCVTFPVLGISNNTLGDAFNETKVFGSAYQYVQKEISNLYLSKINWSTENGKVIDEFSKVESGEYTDSQSVFEYNGNQYSVNIQVFTTSLLREKLIEDPLNSASCVGETEYSFIYSRGKIFLFNGGQMITSYKYNINEKTIKYDNQVHVNSADTTGTHYTADLKKD